MSSINPLGRTLDAVASVTTAAQRVSVDGASGVLFLLAGASGATTVTITEANAASGGTSQTLSGTFSYWTKTTASPTWTAGAGGVNGTSINSVTGTGTLLAVFIPQGALSDGFNFLAGSHATGTFVCLATDLNVQRKPVNLASLIA